MIIENENRAIPYSYYDEPVRTVREHVPAVAFYGRKFLTKRQRWLFSHAKKRVRKKWINVFAKKLDKYKKQHRGEI